jgi:hypothetical protein
MKHILLTLALLGGFAAAADIGLLIQFGLGDSESTVWDGSITVSPSDVRRVSGYRFEQKDAIGTMPYEKVTMIKDNVETPLDVPKEEELSRTWTDPKPEKGRTSYCDFSGKQANGELVWVSPMWIKSE